MASSGVVVSIGDVFFLRCTLCDPPKQKYFVVAQTHPLRLFIINSRRTDYAEVRPRIVAASPALLVAQNPFLDHDSVVGCDCRPSHEYKLEQLEELLAKDPSIRRGHLHIEAKRAILEALTDNHVRPRKYVKELLPLWQDAVT